MMVEIVHFSLAFIRVLTTDGMIRNLCHGRSPDLEPEIMNE